MEKRVVGADSCSPQKRAGDEDEAEKACGTSLSVPNMILHYSVMSPRVWLKMTPLHIFDGRSIYAHNKQKQTKNKTTSATKRTSQLYI